MDNSYYTEKIAPKNKPQDGQGDSRQSAQPAQSALQNAPRNNFRPKQDNRRRSGRSDHTERSERNERYSHRERADFEDRGYKQSCHNLTEESTQREESSADRSFPECKNTPESQADNTRKIEIIGVRFKDVGKVYYFSPNEIVFKQGDKAIVETARGIECGDIVLTNRFIAEKTLVSPLKSVLRKASEADLRQLSSNQKREKEIMQIFAEKIEQHKLDMKPIEVEYTFDGSKILFYFTSDGRVDFRELVKDLAGVFRTRIELRQIGVRDEAKMLGGLGICGRPFCCSSFLGEFQPVSIKMAKEQSLSLNPTKISGTCGRLMCCLKYEQDCYEEFLRTTPKTGALVETPEGRGIVDEVNLLTGMLKIKLDKKPDVPLSINKSEVKLIRDGQIKVNREEIKALKNLEDK